MLNYSKILFETISRELGSRNALDASAEFDAAKHMDSLFPSLEELHKLPKYIESLDSELKLCEDELSNLIESSESDGQSLSDSLKGISEFTTRVAMQGSHISQQAQLVRSQVSDLLGPLCQIHSARENVVTSVNVFRRLVDLTESAERLIEDAKTKNWSKLRTRLSMLNTLRSSVELYNAPVVADVCGKTDKILSDIKAQILEDFGFFSSSSDPGSDVNEASKSIMLDPSVSKEMCMCADTLSVEFKNQVRDQYMQHIRVKFFSNLTLGSVGDMDAMLGKLREALAYFGERHSNSFPGYWMVPCAICECFCSLAYDEIRRHLNVFVAQDDESSTQSLMELLRAWRKCSDLEFDMQRRFDRQRTKLVADRKNDSIGEASQENMPLPERVVFEGRLTSPFVEVGSELSERLGVALNMSMRQLSVADFVGDRVVDGVAVDTSPSKTSHSAQASSGAGEGGVCMLRFVIDIFVDVKSALDAGKPLLKPAEWVRLFSSVTASLSQMCVTIVSTHQHVYDAGPLESTRQVCAAAGSLAYCQFMHGKLRDYASKYVSESSQVSAAASLPSLPVLENASALLSSSLEDVVTLSFRTVAIVGVLDSLRQVGGASGLGQSDGELSAFGKSYCTAIADALLDLYRWLSSDHLCVVYASFAWQAVYVLRDQVARCSGMAPQLAKQLVSDVSYLRALLDKPSVHLLTHCSPQNERLLPRSSRALVRCEELLSSEPTACDKIQRRLTALLMALADPSGTSSDRIRHCLIVNDGSYAMEPDELEQAVGIVLSIRTRKPETPPTSERVGSSSTKIGSTLKALRDRILK